MSVNNSCRAGLFAMQVLFLSACGVNPGEEPARYVTWDGLEPDKWASVWLIRRHVDPDAEIVLRPVNAPLDGGIAFGVPDAEYRRSNGTSVYESIRRRFGKDDPALQELGLIIYDIEISPWGARKSDYSAVVEQSFRYLQDAFAARQVPVDCYGRFFDEVYTLLMEGAQVPEWEHLRITAGEDSACRADKSTLARRDLTPFVRRLPARVVLDHIAADRKVVFVDVRETAEYDEFHIPGAVNIQLRDVKPEMTSQFRDADLVIPYCIKDFRGFEMARSLVESGVANVGIMQPYGISGWRQQGLPLVNVDGLSEIGAHDRLVQCARAGTCIRNRS